MSNSIILRGNAERDSLSLYPHANVISWDEMKRKMLSIIPYPGGKAGLVPSLVPLLEWTARQYDLKGYVEATGGGGRCLINMDTNLFEHRIYSDIDFPLCCLFQELTDERSTEELIKKLYRQDYCQEVFKAAVEVRKIDNKLAEEGRFSEHPTL